MRITKRQLRRTLKEFIDQQGNASADHNPPSDRYNDERRQDDYEDTFSSWTDGDFIDAIRDYSKELTGRRNSYGAMEDLESLTHLELSDYYEEMFDSPEAVELQKQHELENQRSADASVGYEDEEHPLSSSPLRQGMGRRTEGILRVTRRQLREVLQQALRIKKQ